MIDWTDALELSSVAQFVFGGKPFNNEFRSHVLVHLSIEIKSKPLKSRVPFAKNFFYLYTPHDHKCVIKYLQ